MAGPVHTRKLGGGRRRRVKDDPEKVMKEEFIAWLKHGGLRQYERDFDDAPIAKLYGMPYRPPLSPQEVARSRGNSHGDGSPGPQDEVS